ncbi:FAD-binding oxidoreductase [Evansella sp. AB-P1]|uniref:NAD(P)/FAD-dependent oxidoreductase n=1 Tax=Evansella sp. AB-P1 TaxID=3037653 RepID=UPI00241EBD76|nr:FAD-binding oxidoreductase [Evansella sp. AB-P1]MDG5789104.1 FAD-binding oxidoreductase [Evansella sp. AB-P1]
MNTYIVVGGGILGASTAYHLTKEGAEVTLVDRHDIGQATDAAAGIVCPWLSQRRNKAWYHLAKNGAKYYPSLIDELKDAGETNTGYAKVGSISIHTDDDKLAKMEERANLRKVEAPEIGEINRLSPKEAKCLFPPLADGFGAIHISGGARVNGRALRDALVQASTNNGAKLVKGNVALEHTSNKVTGVKVGEQILYGDKVILVAGAWAGELLKPLNLHFNVKPQKAQIVHLELQNRETMEWPVIMPPNNHYIVPFEDGRIVIGATHEDEVGFDPHVTAGGLYEIFEKAFVIAPGLKSCKLLETRVGFRPMTPGFLPVIGPVPHYDGLLIANGLGASGLTVGPYLGMELANLALRGRTTLSLKDYDVLGAFNQLYRSF